MSGKHLYTKLQACPGRRRRAGLRDRETQGDKQLPASSRGCRQVLGLLASGRPSLTWSTGCQCEDDREPPGLGGGLPDTPWPGRQEAWSMSLLPPRGLRIELLRSNCEQAHVAGAPGCTESNQTASRGWWRAGGMICPCKPTFSPGWHGSVD